MWGAEPAVFEVAQSWTRLKRQINISLFCSHIPLMDQTVKNPPAMQETRVQSLGQEDSLEKGMATHSSILVWRIPQRSLVGSWGNRESDMTE